MTDPTAPLDDIDLLILRIDLAEWNLAALLDEADRILATDREGAR